MIELIFCLLINAIFFPNGYTKSQSRAASYGAYCGAKKAIRRSCRYGGAGISLWCLRLPFCRFCSTAPAKRTRRFMKLL